MVPLLAAIFFLETDILLGFASISASVAEVRRTTPIILLHFTNFAIIYKQFWNLDLEFRHLYDNFDAHYVIQAYLDLFMVI